MHEPRLWDKNGNEIPLYCKNIVPYIANAEIETAMPIGDVKDTGGSSSSGGAGASSTGPGDAQPFVIAGGYGKVPGLSPDVDFEDDDPEEEPDPEDDEGEFIYLAE